MNKTADRVDSTVGATPLSRTLSGMAFLIGTAAQSGDHENLRVAEPKKKGATHGPPPKGHANRAWKRRENDEAAAKFFL